MDKAGNLWKQLFLDVNLIFNHPFVLVLIVENWLGGSDAPSQCFAQN